MRTEIEVFNLINGTIHVLHIFKIIKDNKSTTS